MHIFKHVGSAGEEKNKKEKEITFQRSSINIYDPLKKNNLNEKELSGDKTPEFDYS